jgi:hypothetical protein
MINDRRDDMTVAELVEELELSHPEKAADFERWYPDAVAAVADEDLDACDPDELENLVSDLRRPLRVRAIRGADLAAVRSRFRNQAKSRIRRIEGRCGRQGLGLDIRCHHRARRIPSRL